MLDLRIVGLRFSSKLRRKHYILSQIKDIKDIGFGFRLGVQVDKLGSLDSLWYSHSNIKNSSECLFSHISYGN